MQHPGITLVSDTCLLAPHPFAEWISQNPALEGRNMTDKLVASKLENVLWRAVLHDRRRLLNDAERLGLNTSRVSIDGLTHNLKGHVLDG